MNQITLSPTDELHLRFDGRIPPHLLEAARRLEHTQAVKRAARRKPQGRVQIGRIRMKPAIAIDMMAGVIEKCALDRREVTRDDFERIGLTTGQIDQWRDEAYRRACLNEPRVAECLSS